MRKGLVMKNLNLSAIADYITIINFVISIIAFVGVSIAKLIKLWFKSILDEWFNDYTKNDNTKDEDGYGE